MTKTLQYSVLALAIALSLSTHAQARVQDLSGVDGRISAPKPNTAPEVDPNLAVGGITLLAGTLTILRARRRS